MDLVCSAGERTRSVLVSKALFDFWDNGPVPLWQSFCSPRTEDLRGALSYISCESKVIKGFKQLKNVGVLRDVDNLQMGDQQIPDVVQKYLVKNPIKSKQLELAKKRSQIAASNEKQFAWRETEAEAAFNRTLLLEARDLWWKTLQTKRISLIPPQASTLAAKLGMNVVVIRDAYRYLYIKVQEMLDE